jgi:hypothetical protein
MRAAMRRKTIMLSATVCIVPMLMGNNGGCSTTSSPRVEVVADNYCSLSKKRTWSVNDTPETIDEAIRVNKGIDRACGSKRQTS